MSNDFPIICGVNPFDRQIKMVDFKRDLLIGNMGVYAVCYIRGNSLVDFLYIGASANLGTRLSQRWSNNIYLCAALRCLEKERFQFRIKYLSPNSANELGRFEAAYINYFRPMFNMKDASVYTKSKHNNRYFNKED